MIRETGGRGAAEQDIELMMAEVGRIEEDSAKAKGLAKKMFGGVEYWVPQALILLIKEMWWSE
jgi:hypothetical protein